MLTLYRPGSGWLHRMPVGPKFLLLFGVVLGVSFLPPLWWAAGAALATSFIAYAVAGLQGGIREYGRQLVSLRWVAVLTAVSQLIFLGPEPAVANTARVVAVVAIAALLVLTTPLSALLDAVERALRPLDRLRVDSERIALLLVVTISSLPALIRLAGEVREAQRARGSRAGPRTFVVPFLIVALKHADELGDSLTARGVR